MKQETILTILGALLLGAVIYFALKGRFKDSDDNLTIQQLMDKYGFDEAQATAFKNGEVYRQ